MTYRIIQKPGPRHDDYRLTDTSDIIAWAIANDINVVGVCNDQWATPKLRNQPILEGFHGPAHGGNGVVRYEDWETYNLLTMD